MFERRQITVNGLRIRVTDEVAGAGTPLVVIPGHTSRLEGFDELVSGLTADERRVVVIEFPGCGDSDRPDRRYDLAFYEETFLAALDELGITTAIPVGGSLGGNLVLRLGHRCPERFPLLVCWAPGGAWPARPAVGSVLRSLVHLGRPAFWTSAFIQSRFWYDKAYPGRDEALASTFRYYRDVMSPGFLEMYWGMAADQVSQSLFDIAPSIGQPTLMMWGSNDHGARMGHGVARLVDLLPDASFVALDDARHSIESEVPEDMVDIICDFLRARGG